MLGDVKSLEQEIDEYIRQTEEQEKEISKIEREFNINDLETGSYARNLFERHNEKIDSIEKASLNREALANFAAYICDPNRKEEI